MCYVSEQTEILRRSRKMLGESNNSKRYKSANEIIIILLIRYNKLLIYGDKRMGRGMGGAGAYLE